ncbi:MAG TPA: carbohydrate ABC transporter permease, partial [Alphaproteobacteria bacterium]|nr:carbohydrate ABC transporter permease [Alphaproteobacteria bacterium]
MNGLLALFALVYLVPAAVVLLSAFKTAREIAEHGRFALPQSLSFGPWVRAWTEACVSGTCQGIGPNFLNSLKITIPATLVSTALGVINGYVLSKWRFRGSELIFAGMLFGVFLPAQVTLLPWAFVIGQLHLANSMYGLILIHSVMGLSFTTLFSRNFYAQVPDELVKAARIDGAGFWRILLGIMLPLSPPILVVCVIWQFTQIWNEYLYGVVFTSGTEQPITAALRSVGAGGSSATALMAALPPLLVFALGGKYFARGLLQG